MMSKDTQLQQQDESLLPKADYEDPMFAKGPAPVPMTMPQVIQAVIASGADPAIVKQTMELQERYEANEARKVFFSSMADFQATCPEIKKDGEVYNKAKELVYRFAKLETVIATIKATEQSCGFRHRWDQEDIEGGGVRILCHVSHVDGYAETSSVTVPPTKGMNTNAAQDRGIIIKYGKRYSLLNAYGLEPDDGDRDAVVPVDTITKEQAEGLRLMIEDTGSDLLKFLGWAQVDTIEEMPATQYADAVQMLKRKGSR